MCILGNMHGCFYGLWSKNNKYRVTLNSILRFPREGESQLQTE